MEKKKQKQNKTLFSTSTQKTGFQGHQTYRFKIHTFKYDSLCNGTFLNMLIGYFNVYEYIVDLVDLKGETVNPWD